VPASRSVVAYLILSVGGHGCHNRCHNGMGTEGLGAGDWPAPLSGDAQINGR
jgi:hypothetical protein